MLLDFDNERRMLQRASWMYRYSGWIVGRLGECKRHLKPTTISEYILSAEILGVGT